MGEKQEKKKNTLGTRGWSRLNDQSLTVKSENAKIWGETKFQLRENPRSGSKIMSVEEEERRESKSW